MRLALRIAYLGGGFFGSQMQPDLRTVEGEIIEACMRLGLFDDWRSAAFQTAGRTDRGVHARRWVAAFTTPLPDRALQALGALLPPDIWCTGYAVVPESFNPRYDALSRTYRYYFPDPPADTGAMQEMAERFVGRHDFSSFARIGDKNPERTVLDARIFPEGQFCVFEVTAESFLWNMVRCMATAIDMAGRGVATVDDLGAFLEKPGSDRLPASPAEGLILWDVDYEQVFTPLRTDAKSRKYLTTLRRHHALMERISGVLPEPGSG
ncbi:pseudouridine synthase [Methanoculleus taiwanensis]|uniref:tRNA pseudouridine synthase A n=1 Tax=Methanoculleus taiwanensis TaxID=1550565 RepID=A0A498GXY3_9EURY|nr:tRNA pseudouridine(38-40) synthase TruA [Methanoculleus taiwanensis]RXE55599.1 pseudouridine synthase [Methanoculleus taiwanensis]